MSPPAAEEKKNLFAVLGWGLGHATRSIPLIHKFIEHKIGLILGGCGDSLLLLRETFPQLEHVSLPSYGFRYPRSGALFPWAILGHLPRFMNARAEEHRILRRMVAERRVQGVVSDNRYGLYLDGLPSRLLIHQLSPELPAPLQPFRKHILGLHHDMLARFGRCWVPDNPEHDFAGRLSHAFRPSLKTDYLGPLSRIPSIPLTETDGSYDLCAVLSGPEPQRSILEDMVIRQSAKAQAHLALVRGLPANGHTMNTVGRADCWGHLPGPALRQVLEHSRVLLCRPGYSSLMDYYATGLPAILVPTPGQSEQEYLGRWWASRGYGISVPQHDLDLISLMRNPEQIPRLALHPVPLQADAAIDGFIREVKAG